MAIPTPSRVRGRVVAGRRNEAREATGCQAVRRSFASHFPHFTILFHR